jgi:putative MATE family efflux protein
MMLSTFHCGLLIVDCRCKIPLTPSAITSITSVSSALPAGTLKPLSSAAASPVIDVDATQESSMRVVWALAWPAVLLNSFQVVNSLLDRGFVGHLPDSALKAQSASMNIIFLMISLSMTLGTAATALVSRAFGAGDSPEYRAASNQSLKVSMLAGILLAALTVVIAPLASRALLPSSETEAIRLMTSFLLAFAGGMPAFFIIQSTAGSLRGVGDTKSPMVISGMQILLHIILNFILIFPPRSIGNGIVLPGFDLGLLGAGIALSSSAWISALIYLGYLSRTPLGAFGSVKLPDLSWVKRILRIAMPAALMAVLRVGSLTFLFLVAKEVPNGANAIAAMGLAFAIEGIMFMPAFGFSVAAAALVGQSLGMKRPDRAERLGWTAGHFAALIVTLLVVPIFIQAFPIAMLMSESKAHIASEAASALRYMCTTEIFFAYAMVTVGALQGAGDTVRPMWITIIALWGLRVPLTLLLALTFKMGTNGIWLAITISQAAQGIMAMAAFKQGAWKLKKV